MARAFFSVSKDNQVRIFELLGPEKSAALISKISGLGSTTIVEQLSPAQAIQIVKEMSRDQQADLLRKIERRKTLKPYWRKFKPQKAQKIRKLISYAANTAGALMITEFLSYGGVSAGG